MVSYTDDVYPNMITVVILMRKLTFEPSLSDNVQVRSLGLEGFFPAVALFCFMLFVLWF